MEEMMKRNILLFTALTFLVGCVTQKPLEEPQRIETTVLRVACDATFPPMGFINGKEEVSGFDIDLIKAVGAEIGLTLEIKVVGWDRIFSGLNYDEYDLVASAVTITEERKVNFYFSDPYLNAGQVIVAPVGSTLVDLKSLSGKRISVQVGTTGDFEISKDPKIIKRAFEDTLLCFEELINNRVDGVVVDFPIAGLYLKNPRFQGKIKVVSPPFTNELFGFALKKGNTALLEKINKGLAGVKGSGMLAQIETKWLK